MELVQSWMLYLTNLKYLQHVTVCMTCRRGTLNYIIITHHTEWGIWRKKGNLNCTQRFIIIINAREIMLNLPSTMLVSLLSLARVMACSHTSFASRWASCLKHEIAAFRSNKWLLDKVRCNNKITRIWELKLIHSQIVGRNDDYAGILHS